MGVCAFIAANENAAQRANLKSIITVQAFSLKISLSGRRYLFGRLPTSDTRFELHVVVIDVILISWLVALPEKCFWGRFHFYGLRVYQALTQPRVLELLTDCLQTHDKREKPRR